MRTSPGLGVLRCKFRFGSLHPLAPRRGPKALSSPSTRPLTVSFLAEGFPAKIDYGKKKKSWYPDSNLSTGGPSVDGPNLAPESHGLLVCGESKIIPGFLIPMMQNGFKYGSKLHRRG